MESTPASSHYPVSVDAVRAEVSRKARRANRSNRFTGPHQVTRLFGNVWHMVNAFGEKVTRVDGDIPADLPVRNGDRFLFISYDQSALTHGLRWYQRVCSHSAWEL